MKRTFSNESKIFVPATVYVGHFPAAHLTGLTHGVEAFVRFSEGTTAWVDLEDLAVLIFAPDEVTLDSATAHCRGLNPVS